MRARVARLIEPSPDCDRQKATMPALCGHVAAAVAESAMFFVCVALAMMVIS